MEKQKRSYKNFVIIFAALLFLIAFAFAGCDFFEAHKTTQEKITETQKVLTNSSGVTMQDQSGSSTYNAAGVVSAMLICFKLSGVNTTEDKKIYLTETKMQALGYPTSSICKYLISNANGNLEIKMFTKINGNITKSILKLNYSSSTLKSITLQNNEANYNYEFFIENKNIVAKALTTEQIGALNDAVEVVRMGADITISE